LPRAFKNKKIRWPGPAKSSITDICSLTPHRGAGVSSLCIEENILYSLSRSPPPAARDHEMIRLLAKNAAGNGQAIGFDLKKGHAI
jgi:hypothetical protein